VSWTASPLCSDTLDGVTTTLATTSGAGGPRCHRSQPERQRRRALTTIWRSAEQVVG
jgi:hypothetical protein